MNRKRKTIITRDREIYEKFNMLNISSEIILKNATKGQVDKILGTINKEGTVLESEIIGSYILVKRIGDINFNIYFASL
jgi:hypothetical protein